MSILLYEAINRDVYNIIPPEALSVLDIGCGTGALGGLLKQRAECKVVGVTYSEHEAKIAQNVLDEVIVADLNKKIPSFTGMFDCIILSHILEHTVDPLAILEKFKYSLNKNGFIIVALPNILFYKQRYQFLRGKFQYSKEGGIMDYTHLRFFDREGATMLIENAGYSIVDIVCTGIFPQPFLRKAFPNLARSIDRFFVKTLPGLFSWQFIIKAVIYE